MSETVTTNGMSRREELLAVATKLFAARGYHGTRMDDVADAVGLNKATVYHYYASKSLILYDIYKGAADFTVDALHDDPSASAREMIYHFARRLLVGIAGNIERAAVYFQEGPYITEWFTEEQVAYIREKETQVYEHVRDVIDRSIASGELYDCDSHVLALGYIGMTLGSYRWLRPHGRRTAQEDRRGVQHRTAARPDPRRRGAAELTAGCHGRGRHADLKRGYPDAVTVRIGTSGWSYNHWAGVLYEQGSQRRDA